MTFSEIQDGRLAEVCTLRMLFLLIIIIIIIIINVTVFLLYRMLLQ